MITSLYNPTIYTQIQLDSMTDQQLLVATYELQLSFVLLFLFSIVFFVVFMLLKYVLPKFWYRNGGAK